MSVRQVDKRIDYIRPRTYPHSRGSSSSSSISGNPYAPSSTSYTRDSASPSKRRRIESLTTRIRTLASQALRPRYFLYAAGTIIGIYLFLELNRALNPPKLSAHVPVPSGTKDLRIKAQKKVKDTLDRRKEIFRTTDPIERDVGEPDFALLSARQPSEVGCDVPLIGETREREEIGKLILLGVFTTPEAYERRELIRELIVPTFPSDYVTFKFVMGALPKKMEPTKKTQMQQALVDEMLDHGDIIFLAMEDHLQVGKTHQYLDYLATEYASIEGVVRRRGRPRFVLKVDHDTILVAPNVISTFRTLDCRQNVYWGSSSSPPDERGGPAHLESKAYGLSWPLVSWIGSAPMPGFHTNHTEDVQTAQWLRNLDPATDPIRSADLGRAMMSWKDESLGIETVAIHGVGDDTHYKEQYDRIRQVWQDAGRPYDAESGVELWRSVAMGGGSRTGG